MHTRYKRLKRTGIYLTAG